MPPSMFRGVGTALAATALALVTVTGCGGSDGASGGGGDATGAAKHGGSLVIPTTADMTHTDPFRAISNNNIDSSRLNALYDALLYSEPATGRAIPQVAESLTADDPSSATWTLKLHPGVKFTDGTPYDAAAVKWVWDEQRNPARHSIVAAPASTIKSTQVVDPVTLKVVLAAPNANFDRVVASSLNFVASPTALQKDPQGFNDHPVGAGPFVLSEWARGDHMTFTRNPHYWQGPDKPALDKVTFRVITDSDQSMNAVATGQADLKVTSSSTDEAKAKARGLGTTRVPVIVGEAVVFNQAKPPFNDPRARRAVALALDPQEINKTAFSGQGRPSSSIFPENSTLVEPGTRAVPPPDQAEAQRLLDELAAERGRPLEFSYLLPQNNQAAKTGEYIQSRLQSLRNIKVNIVNMTVTNYTVTVRVQRNYEMAMYSWTVSDPEPSMYSYLHSTSQSNFMGYHSQAIDTALDQGRATSDPAGRRAAYTQLSHVLEQDIPMVPYQEGTITAYYRHGVTGVLLSNDGMLMMDRLGLTA